MSSKWIRTPCWCLPPQSKQNLYPPQPQISFSLDVKAIRRYCKAQRNWTRTKTSSSLCPWSSGHSLTQNRHYMNGHWLVLNDVSVPPQHACDEELCIRDWLLITEIHSAKLVLCCLRSSSLEWKAIASSGNIYPRVLLNSPVGVSQLEAQDTQYVRINWPNRLIILRQRWPPHRQKLYHKTYASIYCAYCSLLSLCI